MSNINLEWIIAIIGAIVGSFLTIICTIIWDNHKNKDRFIALLKMLLFELKENQTRLKNNIEKLPSGIKEKLKQGSNLNDEEVNKLGWVFPKSYSIEAWKTFVSSGLVINLPNEVLQKLYKVYDEISSINFLSNLSIRLFQILSQPNQLDSETNKNIDIFCRIGVHHIEFILLKDIQQVVQEIDRIIEIKLSPIPDVILRMSRKIFR